MTALLRERRSWLPPILVAVALCVVTLVGGAGWIGEVLWGQEVIGRGQFLALPLVAASAAWSAAQDRSMIYTVVVRDAERARHFAAAFVGAALPLSAVYAAAHVVVLVASMLAPLSILDGSMWPFLTQVLTALSTWLMGYLAGLVVGSRVIGPVLAALVPAALLFGRGGALFTRLNEMGANGALIGYRADPAQFGARALLLLAISALVAGAVCWPGRRPLLAGAALGLTALGGQLVPAGDGYILRPEAKEVCRGSVPRLCSDPDLAGLAERWTPFVSQVSSEMDALTSARPDTYWVWTVQVDAGSRPWITLFNPGMLRGAPDRSLMVEEITAPRSCSVWTQQEQPPVGWVNASWLVSDYVRSKVGLPNVYGTDERLASLQPARRDQILRAAANALATCDVTAVPPELYRLGPS